MNGFLNLLLNFIYPPKCVFCHDMLDITAEKLVCEKCGKTLLPLSESVCCIRCGKPVVSFGEKRLCYHCLNETHFYYKRIVSALEYSDNVRYSILRYKKNPITAYASVYAEYMYQVYRKEFLETAIDYIVGVPGDKKRMLQRGADHIDVLCEKFSELSGIFYLKGCLEKSKRTKKQSTLSYAERQSNLDGSIKVNKPSLIKDKTILLIDDVCTTRATIKECAKELKLSGAKKIYALTLATTVHKNKDGGGDRIGNYETE